MSSHPLLAQPDRSGLVLIGYRGSGKSTVGKIVAERLHRPFWDTDREVEAWSGRSIAALFAEGSEASFRDWEERILANLAEQYPMAVLATGGGIVLREANRRRIRDFGFVAWLRASPQELAHRLEIDPRSASSRPSLTADGTLAEIVHVLAQRTPLYQALADAVLDTEGKSPESIASDLIDGWLTARRP